MALSKGLIKKLNTLFPKIPEFIGDVFNETRVFIDDDVKKAYEILISGYKVEYNFNTKQFENKAILDLSKVTQAFLMMNKTALEADKNCSIDDEEPKQQENIFEFNESEVLEDYEEEVNPDVEA